MRAKRRTPDDVKSALDRLWNGPFQLPSMAEFEALDDAGRERAMALVRLDQQRMLTVDRIDD